MDNYLEQHSSEFDEQENNLRDYLQVLRKRKKIIFTVLVLISLITVIVTYTATPYYTAYSQVLVERNRGTTGIDASIYSAYEPEFLDTQSEIIRSINVAKRVVETLGLATRYRHYFIRPTHDQESFFLSLWTRANQWVANSLSFFSSADNINSEVSNGGGPAVVAESMTDEELIAVMISEELTVRPVDNTKIVVISYSDPDPAMAKLIANAVVNAYMEEMLEIKLAASSYALKWMTSKAEGERDKLERSERALQKYMRDNDLVTVENKLTIYPQKLTEFSSQLSKAEAERKELGSLLEQVKASGNNFETLESIPVFADSQVLKTVREKIYKANQNIKELSKKYGPKHPIMIKARDEYEVLNNEKRFEIKRIVAATKNAYELAASRERNIKELLADTKSEVLNLNEKFIQYSILKRDVDSNRVLYNALETSIKQQSVTEQSQSVNIWVVQKADLPERPSKPKKIRNIMLGLVLGLFGGIGLAFLIEHLDNTAKSEAELERRYGLTVLGTIENLTSSTDKIESHILKEPLSPLAESYRLIRSGLLLSFAEKPPKTILITSMGAQEGKTSTTINLARVCAQGDRKVLIIDCDLRRPRLHSVFSLKNDPGLSNYLAGASDNDILIPVPGEDLTMITSGPIPPNPAELLSSKRMAELLENMQERFDFILLDSPPVQSVTDSLALGRFADGTIVVVGFGRTTYDMLDAGLKKLSEVNTRFLGFVLNGLKKSDAMGSYYYGYHSYYSKDENKQKT